MLRGRIVFGAIVLWCAGGTAAEAASDGFPALENLAAQDWRMTDRAWQFHAQLVRDTDKGGLRISTGDHPTDADNGGLTLTIERALGRKRQIREAIATPRTSVSRSMAQVGYEAEPLAGTRLWTAGSVSAERRRLVLEGLRGKSLTTREASIAAGWVQDNRWQLSARYLMDDSSSHRSGFRRGLEIAAGAPAQASAMIVGASWSPDMARPEALKLGLEARRGRVGATDAEAYAVDGREQQSLALTLKTGF